MSDDTQHQVGLLCDLENALHCVVQLEDMYAESDSSGSSDIDRVLSSGGAGFADAENHVFYSNPAIAKLLGGGAGTQSHSQQQQQQQQRRKRATASVQASPNGEVTKEARARQSWIELDKVLTKLEQSASHQLMQQRDGDGDGDDEEKLPSSSSSATRTSGRLVDDVFSGRLDRWVRLASSSEVFMNRRRMQQRQQEEPQQMMNAHDESMLLPCEVMLGSAASSVCRSIMHEIMTSDD